MEPEVKSDKIFNMSKILRKIIAILKFIYQSIISLSKALIKTFYLFPFAVQIVIVIVLIAVFGYICLGLSKSIVGVTLHRGETSLSGHLIGYKKFDRLITGFNYTQILIEKEGFLKSEKAKQFLNKVNPFSKNSAQQQQPTAIVGFCMKEYELSVGYDDVSKILEKFINKRNLDINELPEPTILSVNPVSSDVKGYYPQSECDEIDKDEEQRRQRIIESLGEGWSDIKEQGKQVLYSYIKLYQTTE